MEESWTEPLLTSACESDVADSISQWAALRAEYMAGQRATWRLTLRAALRAALRAVASIELLAPVRTL